MTGFGIELLMMRVVGLAFVSAALSPGAQPGKPPPGVQRPEVSVQFALAGGALAVTVYTVGIQTPCAMATTPISTSSSSDDRAEVTKIRRRGRTEGWGAASLRISRTMWHSRLIVQKLAMFRPSAGPSGRSFSGRLTTAGRGFIRGYASYATAHRAGRSSG